MIAIHKAHRRLAEITYMLTDRRGNICIDRAAVAAIVPLLRQNLELVRRLDELRNLALEAHATGDTAWVQEICREIDEMKEACYDPTI